ncbi:MAG: 50S ribosomal protein L9 [Pseudomonadota bacterium]
MKVILTEKYKDLGEAGDIIEVKDGYARNFLIPKKIAFLADGKNVTAISHKKMLIDHKKQKLILEAKDLATKIETISLTISKKVSENDLLYGSVTTKEIEKSLEQEGINVDKKNIIIDDQIKKLGVYNVKVKVASEVEAKLKVWVVEE